MELSDIKGIGPKRLALFAELNIKTPQDLLRFYPREYLDYTHFTDICSLCDGDRASIRVQVVSDPSVFYYKGKYIVSVRVSDADGKATLRWINQPYRLNQFHMGDEILANGIVSKKRGVVLYNPQIIRKTASIIPVYASVKGLTQSVIRDAVAEILEKWSVTDLLPEEWRKRFDLIGYAEAVSEIHFPTSMDQLSKAKKRLSFEETFLYFTAIYAMKSDRKRKNGYAFRTDGVLDSFLKKIPFLLTDAQLRAIREIETDMRSDQPMNRLIQGDVGSGKTFVAEYALYTAAMNGKQGVLLAPTELLAEQHYNTLRKRFETVCLYTGSMTKREKEAALQKIESGECRTVVGTHALLSDSVRFRDLGLVITDEQHRFGVVQRAKIEAKGVRPDVLVMSATPIPRTLALLIYADLDLSIIDQLPPGRKPIKTHFVPQSKRNDLYKHLSANAEKGERAYVVCPLIDQTDGYEGLSLEEVYSELRKMLPGVSIGYLHGQMPERDKQRTMDAFRNGTISILVSTTVVEVGVDVPEATSMVIEGSEHCGLATLHQLRGRVGRGELQSHCYLLSKKPSDLARQRIETMTASNDGFEIAQKDLDMRGSGDLFGVRQSGDSEMNDIFRCGSVEIIELASKAAKEVCLLPTVQYNALLDEARDRYRVMNWISHN